MYLSFKLPKKKPTCVSLPCVPHVSLSPLITLIAPTHNYKSLSSSLFIFSNLLLFPICCIFFLCSMAKKKKQCHNAGVSQTWFEVYLQSYHQWSASFRKSFHIFKGLKMYHNNGLERLRQAMTLSRQSPIWASNMAHSKHEGTVLMITILLNSITSILHRMLQATLLNVWWNYNAREKFLQFPTLWMCYPNQPSTFNLDSQWDWFLMSPITSLNFHALSSTSKLEINHSTSHNPSLCPHGEYSTCEQESSEHVNHATGVA
jgi:hypothetical protein